MCPFRKLYHLPSTSSQPQPTYHKNFHLNDARRNPFIQIQRLYEPSFKQNILYKPSEISFMHKNKMRRDVKIRRGLSFLQFFFFLLFLKIILQPNCYFV